MPDEDWYQAQHYKLLKRFSDITKLLSGPAYPTANLLYQSFCEINKDLISKWCTSANGTIIEMENSMNTKFEKYWLSGMFEKYTLVFYRICHFSIREMNTKCGKCQLLSLISIYT